MTLEQWGDVIRWTGIGGMVAVLLLSVWTLAAVMRGDPATKPARNSIAGLAGVLIGTGAAVLLNISNHEPDSTDGAVLWVLGVAGAAAAFVAASIWNLRRALHLGREGR